MIAGGWDLPGNLGTLIRCADGAGASGVLAAGQGFGLSRPLVLKASMGAALAMPVVAVGRPAARQWLSERGFRIVAAIPMLGISDSLNAAVAGALLLYEALAHDGHEP